MLKTLKLTKAFSDQNRIKIIKMLCDGDKNVSTVADKLNVEENLASHHLRVLQALGFLKNNKKGRQVIYSLNRAKFINLIRDLNQNEFFREVLLEALEEELVPSKKSKK